MLLTKTSLRFNVVLLEQSFLTSPGKTGITDQVINAIATQTEGRINRGKPLIKSAKSLYMKIISLYKYFND